VCRVFRVNSAVQTPGALARAARSVTQCVMTNPNLLRRPWPLGASHFLRDLAFLLLFLVPIALCTAAVFRRAVAMDLAGFGSSTEGAFPPSDMTSSRRCSPDGKRKKKKAICRCASNETRAASKGDMNQNIIIFFPNDTVLWPLSMKSVPTEYGSKALCRIDWCDEPPLGRARALGMRWARTFVFETTRELPRPPSRR
jgi:hypothetical protein